MPHFVVALACALGDRQCDLSGREHPRKSTLVGSAPRISVIIPVFNLRDFVADAIDSVLGQTLPASEIEVVVVDDGSTDGSSEVVARYVPRVRLVRQANRGLSGARNTGIRESSGAFLAFLDADDRLLPEKFAAQLAVFEARSELGLVYTGVRHVDEARRPLPQRGWSTVEGDVLPRLVLGNLIHPVTVLVRRDPVERAGGFDETLRSAEDWDLWLRLSRAGVLWGCVDRPLAEYRVRHDAMHQNPGRMAESCHRVLDKLFADPTLPPVIASLRPLAYQQAALVAACDHYRSGDRAGGAAWFRRAAAARPSFLTEPAAIRLFCRRLLPMGYQRGTVVLAELPRLVRILFRALADLFASPGLDAEIARLRWRAWCVACVAVAPLLRKRAKGRLGRSWGRLRHVDPGVSET
jgi:hypothetical protein